ncbi:MAG: DUF4185 domain-containing protein, partial [Bacteroidota bacterium]
TFLVLCGLLGCDAVPPEASTTSTDVPTGVASPVEAAADHGLTAVPAPGWTALFDRTSGWTGADGIFSVPLDRFDQPGGDTQRTVFLFSDTAIGDVNPDGSRATGTTLVNNTLARLDGLAPDPSATRFWWPGGTRRPRAAFVPEGPSAGDGDWFWNGDGIALDGQVYAFLYRIGEGDGGAFNFKQKGVSLVRFDPDRPQRARQRETPFFRPEQGNMGDLTFGNGLLDNTTEAGAPSPDGFLYVYGVRNDPFIKQLLVARVQPSAIADFSTYRFWNGREWVADLDAAVPVTDRVSNELSVSPLADGRYLLVFQLDALGRDVAVRVGQSPVGPWSAPIRVYEAPEPATDPDTFVYNAKAHPHLSSPGELLISYNVNTFDFFGDFFADADIYRPRFIRLQGLPE